MHSRAIQQCVVCEQNILYSTKVSFAVRWVYFCHSAIIQALPTVPTSILEGPLERPQPVGDGQILSLVTAEVYLGTLIRCGIMYGVVMVPNTNIKPVGLFPQ